MFDHKLYKGAQLLDSIGKEVADVLFLNPSSFKICIHEHGADPRGHGPPRREGNYVGQKSIRKLVSALA